MSKIDLEIMDEEINLEIDHTTSFHNFISNK